SILLLRRRRIAVATAAISLVLAGEVAAQTPPVPPPPAPAPGDTVRPPHDVVPPTDSIPVAVGDTIPAAVGDTVPTDTLPPVVVVAPLRAGDAPGWSNGVWEWDREALLRSTALTLSDLLAQIPGVTPIRSGFWGHPEAVA